MDYVEITNKKDLLSKYDSDYSRLKKTIDGLPEELIDFVPDLADAWSIREQVAHLMDTEIRAFVRYRNAILDPGVDLKLGRRRKRQQYPPSIRCSGSGRFLGSH